MARRITALDSYSHEVMACPFCGETRLDIETQDDYYVCCPCGSRGPLACTEDEAVSLWNQRCSPRRVLGP